jgi:protein phosphatase
VASGERFLVCSDGLTNELEDDEIARLIGEAPTLAAAAQALVDAAVAAGGRDNVTVIVVEMKGPRPDLEDQAQLLTMPRKRFDEEPS